MATYPKRPSEPEWVVGISLQEGVVCQCVSESRTEGPVKNRVQVQ